MLQRCIQLRLQGRLKYHVTLWLLAPLLNVGPEQDLITKRHQDNSNPTIAKLRGVSTSIRQLLIHGGRRLQINTFL